MIFNEYIDILEENEIIFLDEENLYEIMLNEEDVKAPSNSLGDNDSTVSEKEKINNPNINQNNPQNEKTKNEGKGLFNWFKKQFSFFNKFCSEQAERLDARTKEYQDKVNQMPNDYDGEEEVEIPSKGFEAPPKAPTYSNDPKVMEKQYRKYQKDVEAWLERNKKKSKIKTAVKGASTVLGARWLFKTFMKSSGEIDINFKTGKVYLSHGMNNANKASNGNGFAGSLATVIKNIFLAILVVIGGIFKVIKEYFVALGKIIGTVFGTVGQAGKTLVTGQMPGK